jgi:hypothetical protein
VKAGWERRKQRKGPSPGEGQAFELPPPVDETPVLGTPLPDTTAPVTVTPPVVPLGGKAPRVTLPPPGQVELPLEPPSA